MGVSDPGRLNSVL